MIIFDFYEEKYIRKHRNKTIPDRQRKLKISILFLLYICIYNIVFNTFFYFYRIDQWHFFKGYVLWIFSRPIPVRRPEHSQYQDRHYTAVLSYRKGLLVAYTKELWS